MTPTEQDLERAQEFAKTFNDCDFDETYGGGVAILDSGLHRIASLISQVRNETLDMSANKARLAMVGNQDVCELSCSIIAEEIRNLKQEDKEHE